MRLEPEPLEREFRVARIQQSFKEMSREELEEFAGKLLVITSKLTYQTKQLLAMVED